MSKLLVSKIKKKSYDILTHVLKLTFLTSIEISYLLRSAANSLPLLAIDRSPPASARRLLLRQLTQV